MIGVLKMLLALACALNLTIVIVQIYDGSAFWLTWVSLFFGILCGFLCVIFALQKEEY